MISPETQLAVIPGSSLEYIEQRIIHFTFLPSRFAGGSWAGQERGSMTFLSINSENILMHEAPFGIEEIDMMCMSSEHMCDASVDYALCRQEWRLSRPS